MSKTNMRIIELDSQEIVNVHGADLCTAGFMALGGLAGGAIGGYFSGGLAAAGGFSIGVTLGQDLGEFVCSSSDDE